MPISKVERYEWAKPGDKGRPCELHMTDLLIDYSYQRKEYSEGNTLNIARDFNWIAFGTVIVMERHDGRKFIVDGQQRWLAAKRRGDIQKIPCRLFISDGPAHEARAFRALNINRRFVTATKKFQSAVTGQIEPETSINKWVESIGYFITEDGKDVKGIDFPDNLRRAWVISEEDCKAAIVAQINIIGNEPLSSQVFKGLFFLIRNGIRINDHIEKLKMMGGKAAMLREIKTVQIESGKSIDNRIAGLAILRLINFKCRKKTLLMYE